MSRICSANSTLKRLYCYKNVFIMSKRPLKVPQECSFSWRSSLHFFLGKTCLHLTLRSQKWTVNTTHCSLYSKPVTVAVYLHMQQTQSNIGIHLRSCFCPADECKSNIYFPTLFKISINSWNDPVWSPGTKLPSLWSFFSESNTERANQNI